MLDKDSPFFKSVKRIIILIIALALGIYIGGYLVYKSSKQHETIVKEEGVRSQKP